MFFLIIVFSPNINYFSTQPLHSAPSPCSPPLQIPPAASAASASTASPPGGEEEQQQSADVEEPLTAGQRCSPECFPVTCDPPDAIMLLLFQQKLKPEATPPQSFPGIELDQYVSRWSYFTGRAMLCSVDSACVVSVPGPPSSTHQLYLDGRR